MPQTRPDTQETARAPTLPLLILNTPQQCDQNLLFVDLLIIAHHLINVVTVSEGGSVVKARELQRHINCNTSCHFDSCTTSHQLTTLALLVCVLSQVITLKINQLRKLIKYTLTLLDVNPQLKSLAFKLKDYLKPTFLCMKLSISIF